MVGVFRVVGCGREDQYHLVYGGEPYRGGGEEVSIQTFEAIVGVSVHSGMERNVTLSELTGGRAL